MNQDSATAQAKNRLRTATEAMLGIGMGGLVALACIQVVLRYMFDSAIIWIEEVSVIVVIAMVWLATVLIWIDRGHIALDLVVERLPARWRTVHEVAMNLILVALAAGLAVAARATFSAVADLELAASELPVVCLYYPVTAGALGLVAAGLHGIWRAIATSGRAA